MSLLRSLRNFAFLLMLTAAALAFEHRPLEAPSACGHLGSPCTTNAQCCTGSFCGYRRTCCDKAFRNEICGSNAECCSGFCYNHRCE